MAAKKVSKKKTATKAVVKKAPASDKAAADKPAKKAVAKKAPASAKAAADKPVKKAPAKKTKVVPVKKPVLKQAVLNKNAIKKVKRIPVETLDARIIKPRKIFKAKELSEFKERLLTLRERVSGEYSALKGDNMAANQRDPSLSDQGTDTFDREMELNMMGSEQEVIFEIDAALRRLEKGTYGICELTEETIPVERLKTLPYVRYTVHAQSELERGRSRFRPFGGTMHSE